MCMRPLLSPGIHAGTGVLHEAQMIRVEAGGDNIACTHIADALMVLAQRRTGTLSD